MITFTEFLSDSATKAHEQTLDPASASLLFFGLSERDDGEPPTLNRDPSITNASVRICLIKFNWLSVQTFLEKSSA